VPQNPLTEDNKQMYDAWIAKLLNPFTPVEELRDMYMLPVPPKIGQIQCTIMRHKNGMNRFWPKYTLQLSSNNQFLLTGKKRAGNATSNYLISMDQEKVGKTSAGFLGKVRSNFLGTEFSIYDNGANPEKAKSADAVRS
jgi:tubby and related proteins